MFTTKIEGTNLEILMDLPQGLSQQVLVNQAREELLTLEQTGILYGKHVNINGRITTGMALMMGHFLAHITKSVSIFDPKENLYVLCVRH